MNQEIITLPSGDTAQLAPEQVELMQTKAGKMQQFSQQIFKFEVAESLHLSKLSASLKIPATTSDIPEAEKTLDWLKSEYKACEERTKEFTVPLNGVIDRLNGYKKQLVDERTEKGRKVRSGLIPNLEAALLPLKQKEASDRALAQQRAQELHNFRLSCINGLNDAQAKAAMAIEQMKTAAYTHALEHVAVVNIDAYRAACKQKVTATTFTLNKPFHCNDLEKEKIINEVFAAWNPDSYAQQYHNELAPLFADFANAKENAAQAAQLQREQEFKNTMQVAETATAQKAAATIQAAATPTPSAATIATKELKTAWKVDMPDDWATVLQVMQAYSVCQAKVQDKLRVSSVFNLTIAQLMNALAAIKNDDQNFAPQGIIFTQVNKL